MKEGLNKKVNFSFEKFSCFPKSSGFGKRGISAVIATVLVLLITIIAVSIIWMAVVPMIREKISAEDLSADLYVATSEGYTVYDKDSKLVLVQLKRGSDDSEISGSEIIFSIEGNSYKYLLPAPGPNNAVVYCFDLKDYEKPDFISVAPVFVLKNKEKVGKVSSKVSVAFGNVPDSEDRTCLLLGDECVPNCEDKACGDDGCERSCGTCSAGKNCVDGQCVSDIIIPQEGLIAYWNFDDSLDDSVDNADGEWMSRGEDEIYVEGKQGKTLDFGSDRGYVGVDDVGDVGDLRLTNTDFTISAWIYLEKYPDSLLSSIISKRKKGYDYNEKIYSPGWYFFVAGETFVGNKRKLGLAINSGQHGYTSLGDLIIPLNEWVHVVVSFDDENNNIVFYVNGVFDASRVFGEITNSDSNLFIGADTPSVSGGYYFEGNVDEVIIWNRVLSEEEIKSVGGFD